MKHLNRLIALIETHQDFIFCVLFLFGFHVEDTQSPKAVRSAVSAKLKKIEIISTRIGKVIDLRKDANRFETTCIFHQLLLNIFLINVSHPQAVDMLLRNFCQCLLATSRANPPNK